MLTAIVMAAATVGCQSDTSHLEKKIDDLSAKMDAFMKTGGARGAGQQQARRPEPDRAKTYSVPIEGDPFEGPADAKVTLVKAYDYACPYCEKVRDTMDQLRQKYGNDLRVVYKQFVVHPQVAMAGALASCAADKQGKFVEFDKALWDKGFKGRQFDKDAQAAEAGGQAQRCWETDAGCPVVLGFATELGLDQAKFKADMKTCSSLVQKDMKDLQQLGVGATPSFFINGRFLSGAMPIDNFSALIDEELKKANEQIQKGTPQAQYYQQMIVDKGLKTLQ
jgi:protein-disulfide isomerase|nr:thioredoxin domain-containing protein [Kofleriaceae bacterium]